MINADAKTFYAEIVCKKITLSEPVDEYQTCGVCRARGYRKMVRNKCRNLSENCAFRALIVVFGKADFNPRTWSGEIILWYFSYGEHTAPYNYNYLKIFPLSSRPRRIRARRCFTSGYGRRPLASARAPQSPAVVYLQLRRRRRRRIPRGQNGTRTLARDYRAYSVFTLLYCY